MSQHGRAGRLGEFAATVGRLHAASAEQQPQESFLWLCSERSWGPPQRPAPHCFCLRAVPILAPLSREEKLTLLDAFEEQIYAPSTTIIKQVRDREWGREWVGMCGRRRGGFIYVKLQARFRGMRPAPACA